GGGPVFLPEHVEAREIGGAGDADAFFSRLRAGTAFLDCGVVLQRELDRIVQRQRAGTRCLGRRIDPADDAADKREPDPPQMTTSSDPPHRRPLLPAATVWS